MKIKIASFLIVLCLGTIFSIKSNPPLEEGTIAGNMEGTSVVIGLGNKGFTAIHITNVSVNNEEAPTAVNIQINHPDQGFIITDAFSSPEAKAYHFTPLTNAKIKRKTIIREMYKKQDTNQVKEDDKIYGLTIVHHQPIHNVQIHYRYIGFPYTTEVSLNNTGINPL